MLLSWYQQRWYTTAGLSGIWQELRGWLYARRNAAVYLPDEIDRWLDQAITDCLSKQRIVSQFEHSAPVSCFSKPHTCADMNQAGVRFTTAVVRLKDCNRDVVLKYCSSMLEELRSILEVCQQCSAIEAYPRSPSALAFRKLGEQVTQQPLPQTTDGYTEFFLE